ncbi:hypothetical protein PWT90_07370 [Aphanocladium album]|nr:hypothetical protein PWT90_07370 [Aphanocladium album]
MVQYFQPFFPLCLALATASFAAEAASFLDCVGKGLQQVGSDYQNPVLFEAAAVAPDGAPVNTISKLENLRLTIRVDNGEQSGGVVTTSTVDWSHCDLGPLQYIPGPWLGDEPVKIEPGFMDPSEADDLLKAAGYATAYDSLILRWPVFSTADEAYYIFHLAGEHIFTFVGTSSKKVFQSNGNGGRQ